MTGARARTLAAGAAAALALPLAGCANSDALSQARAACDHVNRSIVLYRQSQTGPPEQRAAGEAQALLELRRAQPLAATAAGQEAQWQALMTDISESSRVPLGDLVPSLAQLCGVADSPGGQGGQGSEQNPGLPGSSSTVPGGSGR